MPHPTGLTHPFSSTFKTYPESYISSPSQPPPSLTQMTAVSSCHPASTFVPFSLFTQSQQSAILSVGYISLGVKAKTVTSLGLQAGRPRTCLLLPPHPAPQHRICSGLIHLLSSSSSTSSLRPYTYFASAWTAGHLDRSTRLIYSVSSHLDSNVTLVTFLNVNLPRLYSAYPSPLLYSFSLALPAIYCIFYQSVCPNRI